MTGQQPLGELLVEMGFIDEAQLARALGEQRRSGKRLGKILVESSLLSEDRLVHALSRQLGVEPCDPIMAPVHPRVWALVPAELAFEHRVLPMARQRDARGGELLYLATADPLDQEALDAVRARLPQGTSVRCMLAGETEMDLALARHYGSMPAAPARTPAPRNATPSGVHVIRGTPVSGVVPRLPTDVSGLGSLSSTDDIFTALRAAREEEPPPPKITRLAPRELVPLPPQVFDLGASAELTGDSLQVKSSDLASLDLRSGDLGSLDLGPTDEEILIAEEVVDSGTLPNLTQSMPEPPAVDLAPQRLAETPVPTLPHDSLGSWGDLVPAPEAWTEIETARPATYSVSTEIEQAAGLDEALLQQTSRADRRPDEASVEVDVDISGFEEESSLAVAQREAELLPRADLALAFSEVSASENVPREVTPTPELLEDPRTEARMLLATVGNGANIEDALRLVVAILEVKGWLDDPTLDAALALIRKT